MKAVLCVSALLTLCIGAMALVSLDGCQRGGVKVYKIKDNERMRHFIESELQFEMNDADIIAGFMVYDEYLIDVEHLYFAGNQKNGKAVTFIFGWHKNGDRTPLERIPYSMYYRYLECEVETDEEDTES